MNNIKLLVDENVDFKIFSEWWDYNLIMSYAIMLYPNNDRYHMISLYAWLNNYPNNKKISQEELKERINKLNIFISSQSFMNLDVQQKTLISEQHNIMTQYLNVLNSRIDITLTNEEKEELKNE